MSFQVLFDFEEALAEYTGAPYVVVTDSCTNALELCFRWDNVKGTTFTPYTYLSVPMLMHRLGIKYTYHDVDRQHWIGEYKFEGTRIWDSARRLEPGMYRAGQLQCLSFGNTKPMHLGRCGAILTDDPEIYDLLSIMRADGRNLRISPWPEQHTFNVIGYHYCPTLELCEKGLELLPKVVPQSQQVSYPDCRKIIINS